LFLIPSLWDSPLERRNGEKILRGKTKRESQKRKKRKKGVGKERKGRKAGNPGKNGIPHRKGRISKK
jgi:hypothetical protein